ncbi:MAG: molecular chaperone HtpG [Clostridiaceae bacterium]|nr:molecular chaperone HtpG [Clostridiaceae bacterium]
MKTKKGQLQVSTENIFPIIRQWLYSDRDIFLRELISNAADALTKLRQMSYLGKTELDEDELRIEIRLDEREGKLLIADNGIGMTAEDLDKYINQIAYSGMTDFVTEYQESGNESKGFIGHFGLGFYSAFMVADHVEIDTLSWQPEASPALWQSNEGIEFEISNGTRSTRGSTITLFLTEEDKKWLTDSKVKEIIDKNAHFLSWPIYYISDKNSDNDFITSVDMLSSELKDMDPVNNISPLWLKPPSDITDEEYINFYTETFKREKEPLFWVHLNMDYPFRLKGILYFPKFSSHYESLNGRILIFYNQVFVADNVKEVIPEYLFLLQGVLDSPDLPLNVSRSFLQTDPNFKRLSQHIVKKVADRLKKLFNDDREYYEQVWPHINLFVKYGILSDPKFYDGVKDALIYADTDGGYVADTKLPEGTVLYTPAEGQLSPYIRLANKQGKSVLIMDQDIDAPFMSFLEYRSQGKRKFVQVDTDFLTDDDHEQDYSKLLQLFPSTDTIKISELKVSPLGKDAPPALLHETETIRRLRKLSEQMGLDENVKQNFEAELESATVDLILNEDSKLTNRFMRLAELESQKEKTGELAGYILALAQLAQGTLTGSDLADLIEKASELADRALDD